ncbi:MAG: hypothetical protein KC431_30025, partial [Myxococcales bacterium]|nr:hypothetical protein [Myxococcales bacterium]
LFGLGIEQLLESRAPSSPATLLFRSAAEYGGDLGKALRPEDLRVLGDFLVCTASMHALETQLDCPSARGFSFSRVALSEPAWQQGQEFAARVREELGLGDEPIPSMISLLQDRLHWSLFFITPDRLSSAVEGASTLLPKPAILINLVGGSESWWHTRVCLAHEMCHLLFDSTAQARPYAISPMGGMEGRKEWRLLEHFRGIEQRANAFAVHFLAPSSRLRREVGKLAPDSEQAITAICRTFGIGRVVAIRRLGHEYGLSDETQRRMLEREPDTRHERDHADAAEAHGFRAGRLTALTITALKAGKIDAVSARSILRVPMSEPLPGDGGPELAPLISKERLACYHAEAHLRASDSKPWWSSKAHPTERGWEVQLHCGADERTVVLSPTCEPLDTRPV